MAVRTYKVQINPNVNSNTSGADFDRDFRRFETLVTENSGSMLASPLVYPPVYIFSIDQDAIGKVRELGIMKDPVQFEDQNPWPTV
ncbi:hypothetical protein BJ508DRAFT_326930 [Ascobolus immersus RN42]|uniref:Uncharacterized protein n=1 Tax=Ascobolus immersus RN42 TaxID=1160509 RepID=A0A3N4I3Z3_ASCIM|nr:hypothetical protein BJ508DRAFT_326930 [Ascobolus immersus RN42]